MKQKTTLPHPIPYQGSKRNLAGEIFRYFPSNVRVLYEPFGGSLAITIASAANNIAKKYRVNDLNGPLMALWRQIIDNPDYVYAEYKRLWLEQLDDPKAYYTRVREEFNSTGNPALFLYLLARCVKASVRYNSQGQFNQSADNRRKGMKPETMRLQLLGASRLLKGRTSVSSVDYRVMLKEAQPDDLVYMDPPYQGVCGNRDSRYLESVDVSEFIEALAEIILSGFRYFVSYDGRTCDKQIGRAHVCPPVTL